MPIVPSGKRKLMVAQTQGGSQLASEGVDYQGLGELTAKPKGAAPAPEAVPAEAEQVDPALQNKENPAADPAAMENAVDPAIEGDPSQNAEGMQDTDISNGKESLRKFVESFYSQKLKFPPRAVRDHRNDIISRDVDAEGHSNIRIVIPNEYYGTGDEFGREDVIQFAKLIRQKFELFFMEAKDDGKVWTFQFDSRQPESGVDPSEMAQDPLAPFLGKGTGSGDESGAKKTGKPGMKNKKANTIHELLKKNQDSLIERLIELKKSKM